MRLYFFEFRSLINKISEERLVFIKQSINEILFISYKSTIKNVLNFGLKNFSKRTMD